MAIHQYFPAAKYIVMLRDPVDRMYSHFHIHLIKGDSGGVKEVMEVKDMTEVIDVGVGEVKNIFLVLSDSMQIWVIETTES